LAFSHCARSIDRAARSASFLAPLSPNPNPSTNAAALRSWQRSVPVFSPRISRRISASIRKLTALTIWWRFKPRYKLMLKEAGWRDRTEEEGIWTKQIPRDSGWQPAADAERLFKQIANEIRAAKGLGAVLSL